MAFMTSSSSFNSFSSVPVSSRVRGADARSLRVEGLVATQQAKPAGVREEEDATVARERERLNESSLPGLRLWRVLGAASVESLTGGEEIDLEIHGRVSCQ
jgi:hypothetical protein